MENLFWIILIILLMVLGIILFFIELETEEIEYFGPLSITLLFSGVIIWFIVNGSSLIIKPDLFLFFSILITSIPVIILVFTIFLIKKIRNISTKSPEFSEDLVGFEGICTEKIEKNKDGYVKCKSELWKAKSEYFIQIGQKVKIIAQNQLLIIVEPLEDLNPQHCPNCGNTLPHPTNFCTNCGIKFGND